MRRPARPSPPRLPLGAPGWDTGIADRPTISAGRLRRSATTARLLSLLLVLPLVVGLAGPGPARGDELADAQARQRALAAKIEAQRKEVARLRSQQAGLKSDIADTKTALAEVNADLVAAQQKVKRLAAQVAAVKATYEGLVRQIGVFDREIVGLEAEEAERTHDLDNQVARLEARIREAYRTGRTSLLETVLSAETFTDVLEDVGSYMDLGGQDRDLAVQIERDREMIRTVRDMLAQTRSATTELRNEAAAQKKALDARMKDFRAAQKKLTALQKETQRQLAAQRTAYARLAANQDRLQASIAANEAAVKKLRSQINRLLAAQRNRGNIPSEYSGTLRWPMAGVITQEFGCTGFGLEPSTGGCAHFHNGIDIAAPMYRAIRAAGDGVVLYTGGLSDGAWVVVIAHSSDLVTWYGHVDNRRHRPVVHAGQRVKAGQVIAYVGMTGMTTGPHLHWIVQLNGDWVNPRKFV
ncbi:MAG: peptidoglycan DD-metalloendopeptidase family protein [Chloroflexi bacterium]|nr:peptidoglycan DD-metalloendopeptidase family protein [Chloroflexota bacterium]